MAKDIKLVFIDVETTGLNGKVNGIHQISGIIDVNGKPVDEFDYLVSPFETDYIVTEALKTSKVTREMIFNYPDPKEIHEKLTKTLSKHVNKYKRTDKYFFVAYNSNFDNDHIRQFWIKNEDKFYGSYFYSPEICVMRYAARFLMSQRNKLVNFKLKTVAEYLGLVEVDSGRWHNAKFDIEVTRKLYYYLEERTLWGNKKIV